MGIMRAPKQPDLHPTPMSDSLIINARSHLCWRRRLCCDATTAMLWGYWLWLCRPVIGALDLLGGLRLGLQASSLTLASAAAPLAMPVSLQSSLLVLASTSSSLLLWSLLTERRSDRVRIHRLSDYARHFGLSEQTIVTGRSSSVCLVHHDEQGRIVAIENRA